MAAPVRRSVGRGVGQEVRGLFLYLERTSIWYVHVESMQAELAHLHHKLTMTHFHNFAKHEGKPKLIPQLRTWKANQEKHWQHDQMDTRQRIMPETTFASLYRPLVRQSRIHRGHSRP